MARDEPTAGTLIWIDRCFLDDVWPTVAPLLARAVACNRGEASIDQVRAQVVYGQAELLVAQGDDGAALGAAIVQFVSHPGYRVANVSYLAGRTSPAMFEELKRWCRSMGASKLQGIGSEATARLWSRYGFEKAYVIVRADL